MKEEKYWVDAFTGPLKRLGRIIGIAALAAIVPAILLYVFGFSIKTTSEYRCVMRIVEENGQVVSATGAPVKPGWFAWIKYYESGGMLSQGNFFTSVSGPKGGGTVEASFYRAPIGATLGVWFTSKDGEIEIFDGDYPCDD